jgi:ankyrin repeat protein
LMPTPKCFEGGTGYGELPIHCAVDQHLRPEVVRCLATAWPESLRETTDDVYGFLPAHLACWRACYMEEEQALEILKILLDSYPEALQVKGADGEVPLHACFRHEFPPLAVVRYVVQRHPAALHATDKDGFIPLHHAVATARPSLPGIMYLIGMAPESVRATSAKGATPLMRAAAQGGAPIPVVQCLLSACPESVGDVGWNGTVLHEATKCRNVELVEYLLNTFPDLVQVKSKAGKTPLHVAASVGSVRLCKLFVRHWPEAVREPSNDGTLPVHEAASAGKKDALTYLVRQWPESAREKTADGWLPLHSAVQVRPATNPEMTDAVEMVNFILREHPEGVWDATTHCGLLPLHVAVGTGRGAGSDESNGRDARNQVARHAQLQFVQLLVRLAPASVRVMSNEGMLPFHTAIDVGCSVPAARFLLQTWPDVIDFKTGEGYSALHLAASRGDPMLELVEFVAGQRPALLDEKTNDGQLPVHFAVRFYPQPLEVVKFLVERRPQSLAHADADGALPLHLCFFEDSPDFENVQYLVDQHPQAVDAADKDGRLPLHWAVLGGDAESLDAVRRLVDTRPRTLRSRNREGWIPLHVAAMSDAALDLLFHLASTDPESFLGEGRVSTERPRRRSTKRPKRLR